MQNFDVDINEQIFIGMNDKYPSHLLPKGVFSLIQNAYVDNNKMFKRGGSTAVGISLGAFTILGGSGFEPAGGSKYIIVCRDGSSNAQLYKSTGGNFSAIGSANLTAATYMNFVQAANYLFGFNGIEVVDVASDGSTVTRNRSGVPKGTFGFWFHNYLFVGGVTTAPNRLYWSNLGDPTTFDSANYIDINANDGDSLTGLNTLNDELVVFKKYSIWSISGWSGATFSTTTIAGQNTQNRSTGIGTISHQSIVSTGRDLYYLSFLGGTPHIRSLTQTIFAKSVDAGIISDEIEGTMMGLNMSALQRCAGMYDGKYAHWALANGSSTTNNLVIVLSPGRNYKTPLGPMQPWTEFTGITPGQFISSTISGRSKLYYIDATTGGYVFLFNDTSTYSDNGTAVTMTINTRDFMGDTARKSKYKEMFHKYKSGSAGTLNVNARIDQAADWTLQEAVSLQGNSPGLGPTGNFTLGVSVLGGAVIVINTIIFQHLTGSLLGVQFKESTANYCELYDYRILGMKKGFRVL